MNWNHSLIENLSQASKTKSYSKHYKLLEQKILTDATNISNTLEWLAEKISILCLEIDKLQNAADNSDSLLLEERIGRKIDELNNLMRKKEFEESEWEKIQMGVAAFQSLPAPTVKRKKRKSSIA